MYKLVFCIRRRPDLDVVVFRKHWLDNHGPLVRGLADAFRINRYVQSHTIQPEFNDALVGGRGMAPPYDGVAEVWWDSVEEAIGAFNSPVGQEANRRLVEDEERFIDFAGCTAFMTEELVILE
jgi:uncharacterized protein (TIGR02118 family)